MNIELWRDGLLIMLMGMGFVFFFLVIMIWVMNVNAKIINFVGKFFPEEIEEENTPKKKSVTNNDSEIALAIACAIAAARGGRKC